MIETYLYSLIPVIVMMSLGWGYSLYKANVNIVDSLWPLMFLVMTSVVLLSLENVTYRSLVIFMLVLIWSLRLALHLSMRNWGKQEDHRYRQIRQRNLPHFGYKSLYIVFGLQALLAWIISVPLLTAMTALAHIFWIDLLAVLLWLTGFMFESVADYQLVRFRRFNSNKGRVLNTGLWRYSRHPNYFGEFCIWWSFYLFAASAGAWWTVFAPIIMTVLLLRVSGVSLMEKDIQQRRPEYEQYIKLTNSFFPGPPKPESHISRDSMSVQEKST
jgi:steroid 5-alpha reductase family enzyme